ncbi:hypothetical protein C0995_009657 [Termitomyces sp. Mi166|nr:hypothetical protein C0995_009657 [Termitomyces sp. Mi166\
MPHFAPILQASLNADLVNKPKGQEIDILDRLRTTLELIAQGGLGYTFNSFDRDSKEFNEFHWAITSVLYVLHTSRIYVEGTLNFKKACEIMYPVYQKLLEEKKALYREGGMSVLEENAVNRKDLMTILFKSNWEARTEDRLSDEVICANLGSFVHGAQETTSGAMSRFISLLALKPELQERMRTEVREAREHKGNDDDFECRELDDLPLLDAVCRETLRQFTTMEDRIVPLKYPVYDATGNKTWSLLITKGTAVYLGLAAANRSTAIWGSDANEFKPERWTGKAGHELITNEGARLPGVYSNTRVKSSMLLDDLPTSV